MCIFMILLNRITMRRKTIDSAKVRKIYSKALDYITPWQPSAEIQQPEAQQQLHNYYKTFVQEVKKQQKHLSPKSKTQPIEQARTASDLANRMGANRQTTSTFTGQSSHYVYHSRLRANVKVTTDQVFYNERLSAFKSRLKCTMHPIDVAQQISVVRPTSVILADKDPPKHERPQRMSTQPNKNNDNKLKKLFMTMNCPLQKNLLKKTNIKQSFNHNTFLATKLFDMNCIQRRAASRNHMVSL